MPLLRRACAMGTAAVRLRSNVAAVVQETARACLTSCSALLVMSRRGTILHVVDRYHVPPSVTSALTGRNVSSWCCNFKLWSTNKKATDT